MNDESIFLTIELTIQLISTLSIKVRPIVSTAWQLFSDISWRAHDTVTTYRTFRQLDTEFW